MCVSFVMRILREEVAKELRLKQEEEEKREAAKEEERKKLVRQFRACAVALCTRV